ncbi:uncharacterized protein V6R79_022870 [Siganus canaliculatus]
MEPDVMPLHASSPPPLDDDGDGEAGSEEDEFGDFSFVGSCSPPGFVNSPPSLRQHSPPVKPATHQPSCSFNHHPVKQSQPTSAHLNSQVDEDREAESGVRLTNGVHSAGDVCSPKEETGFADFTVFTEQAAHPWCCGFTPMASTETWDGRAVGTRSSKSCSGQAHDLKREVIMDSEPTSRHCEKREATPVESASVRSGDGRRCSSFNSLQTKEEQEGGESDEGREDQEQSASVVPQNLSVYESASEDLASLCDDLSWEGPSLDLEPNVSSLASGDQTDDEAEELGNFSFVSHTVSNEQSKSTQETSATSDHSRGSCVDFRDCSAAEAEVQSLGNLPPSDSFADFCSAPTQADEEEPWAEFKEQRDQEEGGSWTRFRERVSSLKTDGSIEEEEEEEEAARQNRVSRKNSCQASLSCRIQQLLLTSFPEVQIPAAESQTEEMEVVGLGALLHGRHNERKEEEEEEEDGLEPCPTSQRIWPHQDLHSALGLRFQWGGSHANRGLLRCLGVDSRNIVFMGVKKQPVAVPAFASSLGMLEPTKECVPAVCVPQHTAASAQAPPGPRDPPAPSTHPVQEVLPSSQADWSSRGLSSSQDGTSPRRAPHFWGRK